MSCNISGKGELGKLAAYPWMNNTARTKTYLQFSNKIPNYYKEPDTKRPISMMAVIIKTLNEIHRLES